MAARLPLPGPSFARERTIRLHTSPSDPGDAVSLGMARPTETEDGWWLSHLWAFDGEGIIDTLSLAPRGGPPPGQPLAILGPVFAGALSGLIAEADGRRLIRLKLHPAADESRPWERPCIIQLAVRWEPVRAATMRQNELVGEVMDAFSRALEAAGRPG